MRRRLRLRSVRAKAVNLFGSIGANVHGDMDSIAANEPALADFGMKRVQEDDRIDRLQRVGPSRDEFAENCVVDGAKQFRRDIVRRKD